MTTIKGSAIRFTPILLVLLTICGGVAAHPRNTHAAGHARTTHIRINRASTHLNRVSTHLSRASTHLSRAAIKRIARNKALRTAIGIYEEMHLESAGLNAEAFEYAYLGYDRLCRTHRLQKPTILSICDFSQASSNERLYIIDVLNKKLLYRTYVAHGMNSGNEYACSFSNCRNSHKSSLGFYVTRHAYYGDNGLSLRIDGLDKGFNDMAGKRDIVIHGAPYVSTRILQKYGVMGTTYGCPAIPDDMTSKIIPVIKQGTCFFIYYPSQEYLARSSVLN